MAREADDTKREILAGRTSLGIELGSTRIKAVLIAADHSPLASGGHAWENRLEDGVWTYRLEDVWQGIQACFRELAENVRERHGAPLSTVGAMGVSAMMHGYLVFDRAGKHLAPFRTWRNTMTEQAAGRLTEQFRFNIPQRWSVAHLYQAILNGEAHIKDIAFMTTLAGYVHWKLTGNKYLGVDDASGMFPLDREGHGYDERMLRLFDRLTEEFDLGWRLEEILPRVLSAGGGAGTLTKEGARLIDPSGLLEPGIPLCPPEGDAGTGMVATNSIARRSGNISAGTSAFAMIVLEKELSRVYTEIDIVATPAGAPVAMVHCNNCASDIDAWVGLFAEVLGAFGLKPDKTALYETLYRKSLEGEADGGGLLSYNYLAGEPITGFDEGRPLLVRMPDSRLTLDNFMRALLFSVMGTLKLGMDILTEKEHVRIDRMLGHGGLFKVKGVAQGIMSAALGLPVAVMETAGEGGAWGMAILAAYMRQREAGEPLDKYL
ncbi:MAG: FGGY-family carbohydrate kinase, partial [Candidatus Accumulibacter sp.]|nr:FGGY-family carbohydrate kinase [Accumulibacter sp.]